MSIFRMFVFSVFLFFVGQNKSFAEEKWSSFTQILTWVSQSPEVLPQSLFQRNLGAINSFVKDQFAILHSQNLNAAGQVFDQLTEFTQAIPVAMKNAEYSASFERILTLIEMVFFGESPQKLIRSSAESPLLDGRARVFLKHHDQILKLPQLVGLKATFRQILVGFLENQIAKASGNSVGEVAPATNSARSHLTGQGKEVSYSVLMRQSWEKNYLKYMAKAELVPGGIDFANLTVFVVSYHDRQLEFNVRNPYEVFELLISQKSRLVNFDQIMIVTQKALELMLSGYVKQMKAGKLSGNHQLVLLENLENFTEHEHELLLSKKSAIEMSYILREYVKLITLVEKRNLINDPELQENWVAGKRRVLSWLMRFEEHGLNPGFLSKIWDQVMRIEGKLTSRIWLGWKGDHLGLSQIVQTKKTESRQKGPLQAPWKSLKKLQKAKSCASLI